jgi:hypothetical protein
LRLLAVSLLLLSSVTSSVAAAQTPDPLSGSKAARKDSGPSVIPPDPRMGWVLNNNSAAIAPVFGDQPLESDSTGAMPAVALDGAGNIDGAALIGGVPTGLPLSLYAIQPQSAPSLAAGTTVMLLCGRENNWLRTSDGSPLPVDTAGLSSVSKAGEWLLSLASTKSPFAVVVGGDIDYANAPPTPPQFVHVGSDKEFPPTGANAQVCVWAFYDTSINGTALQPQISVAYDDGAAAPPRVLPGPVGSPLTPMVVTFNQIGADLGTLFLWQGSAAEALFQQPVRAAYWNGGLRKSIASHFQTPAWSDLKIVELDPDPVALGGDAQDNDWAIPDRSAVRTSPFAHYSITTSPGTPFVAVRYEIGAEPYLPLEYSVSFSLDGRYMGYDQPWTSETNYRAIPLPQDGKSHTLDLRNGFVRNNDYASLTNGSFGGGGFIDAIAVPGGYGITVNRPVPQTVALVLSHSVAIGETAATTPYLDQGVQSSTAWPVQARVAGAFGTASVVDESYGGELLENECSTLPKCEKYLAAIHRAQPNIVVGFAARMLNDFYHGRATFGECLPQYERDLENLFRAWAAEFPGVPLYVGSDIRESDALEATTDGCTPALRLADWRQGIADTVGSFATENDATWLHFVDMSQWVSQRELQNGGIHPTVQGQIRICQAVADTFHQDVTCGVPH